MTKGQKKIGQVMREFQAGELHSGASDGPKVTNEKQALAIALSEARQAGARVRKRPQGSGPFTDAEIAQGFRAC